MLRFDNGTVAGDGCYKLTIMRDMLITGVPMAQSGDVEISWSKLCDEDAKRRVDSQRLVPVTLLTERDPQILQAVSAI